MTVSPIEQMALELDASRKRLESMSSASGTARKLSRMLERLKGRLQRPPRIVLLGEFNAGKTTLANALIGADVLPTSFQANTRVPLHVKYAAAPSLMLELTDRNRVPLTATTLHLLQDGHTRFLHIGLPVARLKMFELIDTPGLASGMSRLEGVSLDACKRANIALWCTACTQAWKATEQAAWTAVPQRLKRRALLVATLADALNTDRDRGRVEARLRREAAPAFAGLAMVAAAEMDELRRNPGLPDHAERWMASGAAALDAEIARLIGQVQADRESATNRVLTRAAGRLAAELSNARSFQAA